MTAIDNKLFDVTSYVVPAELKAILRRPLGDLISGTKDECTRILKQVISKENPTKVILVGDTVSGNAVQTGMQPDVIIIDNLEKRAKAANYVFRPKKVIRARNRAGTIEAEASRAVEQAILGDGDLVEVDGEEDLLAIIAVQRAPLGSLVVYGQPDEGIVLVIVSAAKKAEAQMILDQMKKLD